MKLVGLAVLAGVGVVAGWAAATWYRCPDFETDHYWDGFADGELHQRLNDRVPNPN